MVGAAALDDEDEDEDNEDEDEDDEDASGDVVCNVSRSHLTRSAKVASAVVGEGEDADEDEDDGEDDFGPACSPCCCCPF